MIRPAKLADAAPCSKIMLGWVNENPWFPMAAPVSASVEAMRGRILDGEVFVSEGSAGLGGFISYGDGELDCLYIEAQSRNAGLGKALLARAKEASKNGLYLWVLAQNNGARRFYLREGFVETARGDGQDNEAVLPDIKMEWHPGGKRHG
ncbi:MAG: GNAT family N-acetyltransferase [Rhodobacteraceae bacterium]|nr:GNAT family N-acetyltransferase [Paracoccaceae bacterium]